MQEFIFFLHAVSIIDCNLTECGTSLVDFIKNRSSIPWLRSVVFAFDNRVIASLVLCHVLCIRNILFEY